MRFRYDSDSELTVCEGSGLLVWMRYGRDGNEIVFKNDKGERLDAIGCRDETRARRPEEGGGRLLCPHIIIWHVAWGARDTIPKDRLVGSRDLVQAYLEFWQGVKGVGCWIDGEPRDALVEVIFH